VKNALRPVATLLIGVAILLTGSGLQGTLVPVRASIENFSTFAIAAVGASYFLGFTVGCLKGGALVKNVGHVRVFLAMTALASAAPLIHGLVLDPITWSLLRFLTGFCFAVLYVVIESWLNERSSNENRGIVFSTYVMITLTMMAAGQIMTLMYDPAGLELFVISSVLVSVAAVPVALSKIEIPEVPQETDVNLRRLFEISPSGIFGCLATGLASGAFWSFAPVFAAGSANDISLVAWFMTAAVVGGALGQWPLGFLSDRLGRRKTLVISAGTAALVGAIIVSTFGDVDFTGMVLLSASWGFVAFPLYSISVAHSNDYANPADYVMVSSGLLLTYGLGATAGPFIASTLMTLTNLSGLFLMTGVTHIVLVIYVLQRIFRRTSAPVKQHILFSDALATAHTASQVYEEEIQSHPDPNTQN
jgi:MFS family permease